MPKPCWWSNVRTLVPSAVWDRLRRQVYRQAGYRCEICGGRGPNHPVEAHEVWRYDDQHHIQRLEGMVALCPACHEVKHIGLAYIRGRGSQALAHLARVNGWPPDEAAEYVDQAFETWAQRNQHSWQLDLAGLNAYLEPAELDRVIASTRAAANRQML